MTELVLEKGSIAVRVAMLRKPEAISDLTSKYTPEQLPVLRGNHCRIRRGGECVFINAGYGIPGEGEITVKCST